MEAGTMQKAVPRKLKLLIVDDDKAVNETLSLIFRKLGYEVLRSHTGKEALIVVAENLPHIVLLDVALPDISGMKVAIALMRDFPKCKFLLLSGNKNTEKALDDARDEGYDFEVLAKPVPPNELIERVGFFAKQFDRQLATCD